MKRSHAIKTLRNSFIYWANCLKEDAVIQNDEEMYSNILKDMEEAGLMPPKYPATVGKNIIPYFKDGWEKEE
jgi:hypothetical protein